MMTDHLPNGDGLVAYGFVQELATRGYRLHIAAPSVALRQTLPENVTLHVIPRRFAHVGLARLDYMWAIRRLLRRLRRTESIDLVHQMNPVFVGLSLGLIGCGLPVILGTFVARWPAGEIKDVRRSRLFYKACAAMRWMINLAQQSHASVLMITTPAALDRIAAPFLVRNKITVLRHGINEILFSPDLSQQDEKSPSILFYSHLDQRKGVFVLVEAFREVIHQIPTCRLVIVGRGEHEAELRRVIAASGYADQIELRGPVPQTEAPALMRAHTLYCLPSFGEPYGMTALEAMACGRPLVVTSSGGLGYLLPDAGGLRVASGDVAALAAALVEILRSRETQRRMGAANREHVEKHHTWRRVVDELEEIYMRTAHPHYSSSGQQRLDCRN